MTNRRLVVFSSYAPSLVNFRGDLLRDLAADGWEVLACAPGHDEVLVRRIEEFGVRYQSVALDRSGLNPVRDVRTLVQLGGLLRRIRPAAVFAYTIKPVIYGSLAARFCGVPAIVSMITGLGSMFVSEGVLTRLVRPGVLQLYRVALAANRRVVFQNPDDRDLFLKFGLVNESQIEMVAGSGVNLARFAVAPPPGGTVRFLLIARLLIDKGVRELVGALRILTARGYKFACDLVGPIENHPRGIPEAEVVGWQREGLLVWHGGVDDVRPFLRDCSVYVLPSYREGTPRSVLEAMATGRPVITTDAPGCRETVVDGESGFLVPVADVSALADAMARTLDDADLRRRMGSAARRRAETIFDVREVNQRLVSILGGSID